jgi:hypothetical protein
MDSEVPPEEPEDAHEEYVAVFPVDDDHVVAIGTNGAVAGMGHATGQDNAAFARAIRSAAVSTPLFKQSIGLLTGRIVELTPASAHALRHGTKIMKDGAVLAVVKGGDGKFNHILRIVDPKKAAMASALPALAAAIATQSQMAAIEKQLAAIATNVEYLVDHVHHEVDADLDSAMQILRDVYDTQLARGDLDDDEWHRLAGCEIPIRRVHALTSKHLEGLRAALRNEDRGIVRQVTDLERTLREQRAGFWVQRHVEAELGLARWEALYLIRVTQRRPEDVGRAVAEHRSRVADRARLVETICVSIADYLSEESRSKRLFDKVRLLNKRRLRKLLEELDALQRTYRSAGFGPPPPNRSLPVPLDLLQLPPAGDATSDLSRWDRFMATTRMADVFDAVGSLAQQAAETVRARRHRG